MPAKVYYSNKSESSIEDLMDDTPSNYNAMNGRLDQKIQLSGFKQNKNNLLGNSKNKLVNLTSKNDVNLRKT